MSYFGVSLRNGVGLGLGTVPSLVNTPLSYRLAPALNLQFAGAQSLDPRITFTRASTATYFNSAGVLTTTGFNLLTYSKDLSTNWTKGTGATWVQDAAIAPDGTMTALQGNGVAFTIASGTSSSLFQINAPISGNTTYTFSVYIRAQTGDFTGVRLRLNDGTTATLSSTFTVTTEWTRFSLTVTSVAGATVMSALVGTNGFPADLYIWGAQLEAGSAATVYIPTTSATSGAARFDYDPVTLAPKGLLIEESRTNLVTYSEQFDNAAWTKTRASITADAAVSPDGTMDGDKIIADTSASTTHLVSGSASVTSGTSYTLSVFAKAAEYGFVRLGLSGFFTIVQSAIFSLSDGSIGVTTGTITTTSQNIGNGWWRFSITSTATGSGTTATQIGPSALSSTGNFTGDGTSGIYIWGAQLEAGAFATSYIPTVASQVTRASDLALMTGTNFSSWYNATEGTWFADFTPLTSDYLTNKNLFLASDGTTSNFNGLRYVTSGSRPGLGVTTAGTTQASIATTAMVANTAYKMAGAYKLNDFAVSRNGAAVVTDANGTLPTVTQAEIGSLAGSVNVLGSQYIRQLAYYNRRLTNAELQGITS
jgi:hypothetical protein